MRECPRCERCYEDEALVCPEDGANTKVTLPGGPLMAGRYLLEKRLGRGAMGQVYLARDQNLMVRRVAVKTVRPDILSDEDMQEGEAIARFEREARTAASIRHPNVVDVTDFGKSPEGVFYLVMEYVQGETLHQLLRREGTLSVGRTLALLRQVSAGVEAAHDEGILHRDLKPANIFIMQQKKKSGTASGDGMVKVGDFGLAKIVDQAIADSSGISGSGPASRGIIGTPEYMAPEQMQMDTKLDARADVYALGVIAYHMLGGRPPFSGDLTQLVMQKIMNEPPPLSGLRSDIPEDVEHAVMHALEKDVSKRPASVAEWIEQLERAVGDEDDDDDTEGDSRVVVMAPVGAEVYVDDERHGSVGRSGRVILKSIAPGRHVLRVSRAGDTDDERVIEIRPDSSEQIIQAVLRPHMSGGQSGHMTPSRGGSIGGGASGPGSSLPGVVMCAQCQSRFAAGVKFCGRCGGKSFLPVNEIHPSHAAQPAPPPSGSGRSVVGYGTTGTRCSRCGTMYAAGTKFCGRCGISIGPSLAPTHVTPRPGQILCQTCHTPYPAGTRFCGRCGSVIRT
ncbi:MAG: eukaryotic-like serine/threonine-protein kinase [Acidobacteriota bacterium]|jgi:serine/threonine protein kinase|nr:eukaryotic-like serine/threonine-protein kinase [Acidobacteriota bacterium]